MARAAPEREPAVTYSLGAVSRLTGLSAHVLRAWERRYGAVRPIRSPGGTRRYGEADVARLLLLRAAVDAGHPIGEIAALSNEELERRVRLAPPADRPRLEPVLAALDALDAAEAERRLAMQLAALGPRRFATSVAIPLLRALGERWAAGETCVASEHLGTAILRNLLGAALRTTAAGRHAAPILFATLAGERHELGALAAAVVAADAGGNPVFLGADLPLDEVAQAARALGAAAVAVGFCVERGERAQRALRALRGALDPAVELWVGGAASGALVLPPGATRLADVEQVEPRVQLLAARRPALHA